MVPRLKKIWADGAYRGQALANWCKAVSIQPSRWVIERTLGWPSRSRRMSKDYERKVQTSETLIQVAMIRQLVTRLGQNT